MTLSIDEQVDLQAYNTLRLPSKARFFCRVHDLDTLREAVTHAQSLNLPLLLLGGGSNMVLCHDFPGLCILIELTGIQRIDLSKNQVLVRVGAGENWHRFVETSINQGYYGLENLALIPGTVGAAPVQNIGAYGVEIKDFLESVEVLDLESLELRTFNREACGFGYRDSIFKGRLRDRYAITSVTFRLNLKPSLAMGYGELAQDLEAIKDRVPGPRDLFEAVCRIRARKLPDPHLLANAGSFFKNPLVDGNRLLQLQAQYPDLVSYPEPDGRFKLAAGWMIDRSGWKGVREGAVGVHEHQALVLVNYGQGRGVDILRLAKAIQLDIFRRFQVELEIEPRIY